MADELHDPETQDTKVTKEPIDINGLMAKLDAGLTEGIDAVLFF